MHVAGREARPQERGQVAAVPLFDQSAAKRQRAVAVVEKHHARVVAEAAGAQDRVGLEAGRDRIQRVQRLVAGEREIVVALEVPHEYAASAAVERARERRDERAELRRERLRVHILGFGAQRVGVRRMFRLQLAAERERRRGKRGDALRFVAAQPGMRGVAREARAAARMPAFKIDQPAAVAPGAVAGIAADQPVVRAERGDQEFYDFRRGGVLGPQRLHDEMAARLDEAVARAECGGTREQRVRVGVLDDRAGIRPARPCERQLAAAVGEVAVGEAVAHVEHAVDETQHGAHASRAPSSPHAADCGEPQITMSSPIGR